MVLLHGSDGELLGACCGTLYISGLNFSLPSFVVFSPSFSFFFFFFHASHVLLGPLGLFSTLFFRLIFPFVFVFYLFFSRCRTRFSRLHFIAIFFFFGPFLLVVF